VQRIRRHLTYANVMSSLAVFLLLGGGAAFAASKAIGPHRIGAHRLKAGSVRTGKIAAEAVTRKKIRAGAVTGDKLAPGSVGAAALAPGAVTPDKLAPGAQPTPVASMEVNAAGTVISSTPGVSVLHFSTGAYCVKLPFAAAGGAVSTAGTPELKSSAQVTVPADRNCLSRGFSGATVYTTADGTIANEDWGGVFR
jgi:hypothetical protein